MAGGWFWVVDGCLGPICIRDRLVSPEHDFALLKRTDEGERAKRACFGLIVGQPGNVAYRVQDRFARPGSHRQTVDQLCAVWLSGHGLCLIKIDVPVIRVAKPPNDGFASCRVTRLDEIALLPVALTGQQLNASQGRQLLQGLHIQLGCRWQSNGAIGRFFGFEPALKDHDCQEGAKNHEQ